MTSNNTAESIFGKVADLYDEVRPEYPKQLVTDVLQWTGLPENGRMLEIGCGTGKATRLFAPHGYAMTCIDPAPGMLKVASRSCSEYTNIEFSEAKFEEWKVPATPYDLVYSAQAFHWIEPKMGLQQAANALSENGVFSLFWQVPTHPETALREALDDAYRSFVPKLASPAIGEKNSRLWPDVVRDSGHFTEVETSQYKWHIDYDADRWIRLLQTHSDHRVLEPTESQNLFSAVREAIEANGGTHRVEMTTELVLTRKA